MTCFLSTRDVLRVGVLQQTLVAVASADAGLLEAARGRALRGVRRGEDVVDVDVARVDPPGDRTPAIHVLAPHAGVEAVVGVVGEGDRLVLGPEAVEAHHGTERLGRSGEHVLGDALEDRRLEERRSEVGPRLPAGEHGGALGLGVLDVGDDAVAVVDRHQRAHVGPEVVRSRRRSSPRSQPRTCRGTRRRSSRGCTGARCACRSGRSCRTRRTGPRARPRRRWRPRGRAWGSCRRAPGRRR